MLLLLPPDECGIWLKSNKKSQRSLENQTNSGKNTLTSGLEGISGLTGSEVWHSVLRSSRSFELSGSPVLLGWRKRRDHKHFAGKEPHTGGVDAMTSKNEFSRFAVASLNSMESAADLSHKLRILILAEAWLDLAEQTTQMMERESDEAHILMEQRLKQVSVQRH